MTLQTLLQAIRYNLALHYHNIKVYVYVIDLDRVELKEPRWSWELHEKLKDMDVKSWAINNATNTIEITFELLNVEWEG